MRTKKFRIALVIVGALCLLGAGALLLYTEYSEQEAQQSAATVSAQLGELLVQQATASPSSTPADTAEEDDPQAMPTIEVLGEHYIGLLSIPQLGLELPVNQSWSDDLLRHTPCVFAGSIATGNLIIVAHNYTAHFGNLPLLSLGDSLSLLDGDGVLHQYTLTATQQVDGNDLEGLLSGTWDLTLVTCLYGDNTQRVVLRFSASAS